MPHRLSHEKSTYFSANDIFFSEKEKVTYDKSSSSYFLYAFLHQDVFGMLSRLREARLGMRGRTAAISLGCCICVPRQHIILARDGKYLVFDKSVHSQRKPDYPPCFAKRYAKRYSKLINKR